LGETWIPSLDFVPGRLRHQLFKHPSHLAVATDSESLAGPRPAAGDAWLKVVVAGKAKDLEVLLAVVAALKHRHSVMHLEHTLGRAGSANLAGATASHDQCSPAGGGQRLDGGPPVVRGQKPISCGARPYQRCKLAFAIG
jgi:hypothetical protein